MRTSAVVAVLVALAAPASAQVRQASQLEVEARLRTTMASQDSAAPAPQVIATIRVGQTRTGALQSGDHRMSDGTWADIWYVELAARQRVSVEARSSAFNCYVQLLDPWGNKLAEEAGGSGGARVSYTAREAGRFQVVVNNYDERPQTGTYTLTVR